MGFARPSVGGAAAPVLAGGWSSASPPDRLLLELLLLLLLLTPLLLLPTDTDHPPGPGQSLSHLRPYPNFFTLTPRLYSQRTTRLALFLIFLVVVVLCKHLCVDHRSDVCVYSCDALSADLRNKSKGTFVEVVWL